MIRAGLALEGISSQWLLYGCHGWWAAGDVSGLCASIQVKMSTFQHPHELTVSVLLVHVSLKSDSAALLLLPGLCCAHPRGACDDALKQPSSRREPACDGCPLLMRRHASLAASSDAMHIHGRRVLQFAVALARSCRAGLRGCFVESGRVAEGCGGGVCSRGLKMLHKAPNRCLERME